jgi:acyl-CoA thioester hydrolase
MDHDIKNSAPDMQVRVYYEDTDVGGFVYHSHYLNFMERARTEWLRHIGFEQDELMQKQGLLFVVRRVNIDYNRPAYFNQLLTIKTRVISKRKVSLVFEQTVLDHDQTTLCRAEIMIVCVDCEAMQPRMIPETILMEIE